MDEQSAIAGVRYWQKQAVNMRGGDATKKLFKLGVSAPGDCCLKRCEGS